MDKLTLLLLLLFGWLQYSLWLGKNGICDFINIKKDLYKKQSKNILLQIRNDQLLTEINDLNNSYEIIEERSRKELGMIKSNEIFYRLLPEKTEYDSVQSIITINKQ